MLLDVSRDEGAQRHQAQLLSLDVFQRQPDQAAADALAFQCGRDFGVRQVNLSVFRFDVLDSRDQVADAKFVLVQGDIVDQFVIFHNFCFFKSLVLNYG